MSVTFYDKAEAMEYAARKSKEGYFIDICGGRKGDLRYIVTLQGKRKVPKERRIFSPYIPQEEIYTKETNNHMLKRLEESGAKKLRTKAQITKKAKELFGKEGFKKVKIEIRKIGDRDGMSDAEVRNEECKVTLAIHPIHQYTTRENFEGTLKHEINHLLEEQNESDAK